MKNLIEKITYWGQLLLLPIYWFSLITPRNNNIWLFGSTFGKRFADNPRYFYLYISQKRKDIRPIWITHDKSIAKMLTEKRYEAYYYHSLKGIWFCFRAKVYIFDNYSKDINFWTSAGALKINLWHGVGNKRINYDNSHDEVRHPKNIWDKIKYFPRRLSDEKPSHYILTTSPTMSKIFSRAFKVSPSHIIEAGYPRNDALFKEWKVNILYTAKEKVLINKLKSFKKNQHKILGYIPTFRGSEKKFLQIMDLTIFNNFLKENKMVLVCKLHPKSLFKEQFEKINFSNISIVDASIDINSFLSEIDILIADYSSVYSDFMLLDRPVVAFWYDYDEYISNTRKPYFNFEEYMPEVKAENMEQLMESLLIVSKKDINRKQRICSRNMIFKSIKPDACKKLTKTIVNIINK